MVHGAGKAIKNSALKGITTGTGHIICPSDIPPSFTLPSGL